MIKKKILLFFRYFIFVLCFLFRTQICRESLAFFPRTKNYLTNFSFLPTNLIYFLFRFSFFTRFFVIFTLLNVKNMWVQFFFSCFCSFFCRFLFIIQLFKMIIIYKRMFYELFCSNFVFYNFEIYFFFNVLLFDISKCFFCNSNTRIHFY